MHSPLDPWRPLAVDPAVRRGASTRGLSLVIVAGLCACAGGASSTPSTGDTAASTDEETYVDLVRLDDSVLGRTLTGQVTTWTASGQSGVQVPGTGHLDVARAGDGACVVDAAGEVGCFGPVPTSLSAAPPGPFVAFADAWPGPSDGLCALDAAGLLTCWGSSEPQFVDAPTTESFQKVVLSSFGAIGLRIDGSVAFWGSAVPPVLDPDQRFVDVAGSASDFVGVDTAGEVVMIPNGAYVVPPTGVVAVSASSVEAVAFLSGDGTVVASGIDVDFVTDAPQQGTWTSLHGDCAIRDDGFPHCWDLEPAWGAAVWPAAPVQEGTR